MLQGCLPWQLSIARDISLYVSGFKMLFENHRPISILHCFSKFKEKKWACTCSLFSWIICCCSDTIIFESKKKISDFTRKPQNRRVTSSVVSQVFTSYGIGIKEKRFRALNWKKNCFVTNDLFCRIIEVVLGLNFLDTTK